MKKDIHPKYYPEAQVTCSCGNTFTVGSTLPQIQVDICASCHPFFTGEQKYVDTQGRVEKFMAKREKADAIKAIKKAKIKKKAEVQIRPKTLKEMLKGNK